VSRVGTREEWLAARVALLAEEKELTRRSDELARKRQALPWVAVEKERDLATARPSAEWAPRRPGGLAAPTRRYE
jgi:predicted dithiol-disulfide oxidoreductase (DUF899 family)